MGIERKNWDYEKKNIKGRKLLIWFLLKCSKLGVSIYPIGGGAGSILSNPFLPNSQYVFIKPLPLISIPPRGSI